MTETLNGLHSCKPGNDPKVGEVKTFTVAQMTGKSGKQYLKIKAESMERGGSPYRILSAEPTGYTDSYGNISFNLEIEPSTVAQHSLQNEPAQAPGTPPARPNAPDVHDPQAMNKIKTEAIALQANYVGNVFDAAWARAGKSMETLMPPKDAQDMKLEMWYDIKMRLAQFIAIQTDRKM